MLFKSKTSSYTNPPSTPKIGSISLPGDRAFSGYQGLRSAPIMPVRPTAMPSYVVPPRSMTPVLGRGPIEPQSAPYSSRTRTSSLSSSTNQGPMKSIKSILKSAKPAPLVLPASQYTPMMPKKFIPEPVTRAAEQFRPSLSDRRVYSNHSVHSWHSSSSSSGYATDSAIPRKQTPATPSSKRHSESYRKTLPEESKYVLVTETPLKDEAISLSWPLVESTQPKRCRYPGLYFDIGFDPRIPWNIRMDRERGKILSEITRDEEEIPVSTHCKVTKMVITCKDLSRWPVYVERREGIRCIDVFRAIYETFHQPLTTREKRDLVSQSHQRPFEQRCRDSPGLKEYNLKQGMLRVDLLKGHRIFRGIRPSGADWVLIIDKPESRRSL